MELAVVNTSGSEVKKVSVRDDIFSTGVKESVIHSVVRWQRAKHRSGTHATLNLAKMPGGTKKPHKQKGTGRARAGSVNSPLWVGGAVIFGPQPRDYSFKLPRKVRRQALCGAISAKAQAGNLKVVDSIAMDAPKTKDFMKVLSALSLRESSSGVRAPKVTFLFSRDETVAAVSARNIKGVSCLPVEGVNVYDIVNADCLLLSEQSLGILTEKLGNQIDKVGKSEDAS